MPFPLLAQAFSLFHFSPSPEEEEGKGGIFIFPPHYIQYVRFHPPQIPKNWWHTFNIFSVNEMKWNLELENFMPFWTSNFWKWGLSKCQSVILFRRAAPFLCVTNKLFHSSRGCWVLALSPATLDYFHFIDSLLNFSFLINNLDLQWASLWFETPWSVFVIWSTVWATRMANHFWFRPLNWPNLHSRSRQMFFSLSYCDLWSYHGVLHYNFTIFNFGCNPF